MADQLPPCSFLLAGFAAGAAVGIILLICVLILVCDRRRRPYIGSSSPQLPLGMFVSHAVMVCAVELTLSPYDFSLFMWQFVYGTLLHDTRLLYH